MLIFYYAVNANQRFALQVDFWSVISAPEIYKKHLFSFGGANSVQRGSPRDAKRLFHQ